MTELTLRGVHDDEEHLVLSDGAGHHYLLPIDESLYAAVRRDRNRLARIRAAGEPVRPREIQAMIRSGMTAEEVVEATGATADHVRVYEGPVLAERRHIADRAGQCLVYPENNPDGTPKQLLALCRERLQMRDVDLGSMRWDAWKQTSGTWYVELSFVAADKERSAGWEYARGSISPLDDEARWLSDAGPSDSGPIPNFGSGSERVFNIEAEDGSTRIHEESPRGSHMAETGRILESLRRRRGRQSAAASEPDGLGDLGRPPRDAQAPAPRRSLRAVSDEPARHPDGAHTALSAPEDAHDAGIFPLPADEPAGPEAPQGDSAPAEPSWNAPAPAPGAPGGGEDHPSLLDEPGVSDHHHDTQPIPRPGDAEAPRKKGRSSVPRWDEIMFGSKRD